MCWDYDFLLYNLKYPTKDSENGLKENNLPKISIKLVFDCLKQIYKKVFDLDMVRDYCVEDYFSQKNIYKFVIFFN